MYKEIPREFLEGLLKASQEDFSKESLEDFMVKSLEQFLMEAMIFFNGILGDISGRIGKLTTEKIPGKLSSESPTGRIFEEIH